MKKTLYMMAVFMVLALPMQASAEMMKKVEVNKPKLIAALYYADWCGSCKIVDPQVKKARARGDLDRADILFVTFDLTNKTTMAQSEMLASSLGLSDIFAKNAGKTGYMAIIDSASKQQIAKIDKTMKADDISKLITSKL